MKARIPIFCFAAVFAASLFAAQEKKYDSSDFRNYCGLAWGTDARELLQYCKNVGHTNVMYKSGMENLPLASGMTFFIETPEYGAYRRTIDLRKKYSPSEIEHWESLCAVAFPDKPFPQNMATGWYFNRYEVSLQLDMQQKKVHEAIIGRILGQVAEIRKRNPAFKFGGFTWDVPQPHGDFNAFVEKGGHFNRQTTLAHWTGFDGTPERAGIRHDYPTYFEGYFEFFRSLMERARAVNPNAKFIVEPYDIYGNWLKYFGGDFIKSKGADAKKYAADFIWSEGSSTAFATDKRVSAAGYTCADVGNSSPSIFSEPEMRNVAALAATCGSWTSFFGRYGGYNTAPRAVSIRDIPARIKLGKLVPVWENLNNTPLEMRKYENGIYKSPTAYMSPDVYWAVQPERGRIVFVFITERGEVEIPDGWEIESLHHLDGLFGENGKVPKGILKVENGKIKPSAEYLANWAFSAKLKRKKPLK